MCEQRIGELQPGHSLPIELKHLGHPNQAILQMAQMHQQEIQQLKQQLDDAYKKEALSEQKDPHLNSSSNEYSIQLYNQYQQMK